MKTLENTHSIEHEKQSNLEAASDIIEHAPTEEAFQKILLSNRGNISERDGIYALSLLEYGNDPSVELDHGQEIAKATAMLSRSPDALYRSIALEQRLKYSEARFHKEMLSQFNDSIRNYISSNPKASAEEVKTQLIGSVMVTLGAEFKNLTEHASKVFHDTVRGIQHEMAFEQQLDSLGFEYRRGTVEEDLKGIDYVVVVPTFGEVAIDVKASLSEVDVRNSGSNGTAYAINPDVSKRKLTIFSGVTDKDLADGFSVSDEVAASRANMILMPALFDLSKKAA